MFEDTHWLQVKIDEYLQGTPELPQHIIFQASQNFNEKLTRFNSKPRGKSALPSLSQIGKPFCQLHANKLDWSQTPKDANFKIKMTYGDMTEVIAVAILQAAGVNIFALNQRTCLPTDEGDLYGEFDLIIQDDDGNLTMWDIKSASRYAFENKFKSYEAMKEDDSFGYVSQLFGYTRAERMKYHGIEAGGWIAISKETGEMKVCPVNPEDEDIYYDNIVSTIKKYKDASADNFERSFSDVEETWYKKPTGNRKLASACTFCDYRYSCWPNLEYRKKAKSKSAHAYEYYTFFEEEKEDLSVVRESKGAAATAVG